MDIVDFEQLNLHGRWQRNFIWKKNSSFTHSTSSSNNRNTHVDTCKSIAKEDEKENRKSDASLRSICFFDRFKIHANRRCNYLNCCLSLKIKKRFCVFNYTKHHSIGFLFVCSIVMHQFSERAREKHSLIRFSFFLLLIYVRWLSQECALEAQRSL